MISAQDSLGLLAGSLTTIAFIPQIVRIVRTRSAHDISWWMFGILVAGTMLWLCYGLRMNAWPLIIANSVTLGLAVSILFLKRRYHPARPAARRRAKEPAPDNRPDITTPRRAVDEPKTIAFLGSSRLPWPVILRAPGIASPSTTEHPRAQHNGSRRTGAEARPLRRKPSRAPTWS
jgi:MtN3 and saliva related transmembrane protein